MASSKPNEEAGGTRRAHYRVDYPVPYRPTLQVADAAFAVLNVSESGVMIAGDAGAALGDGEIEASIEFCDGTRVDVAGSVLRRERKGIVLHLTQRVPLPVIMAQQRLLIGKRSR